MRENCTYGHGWRAGSAPLMRNTAGACRPGRRVELPGIALLHHGDPVKSLEIEQIEYIVSAVAATFDSRWA